MCANNKTEFFQKMVNRDCILVGAFRNEYGELYVLYRASEEPNGSVFITGDEMDWSLSGELTVNTEGEIMGGFHVNPKEKAQIVSLMSYTKARK